MDRDARRNFFAKARALTPYLAVTSPTGGHFLVKTHGRGPGRALFTGGLDAELAAVETAARLVERLTPERPVFLDAAANVGTATVTALRSGVFAFAVAIEPEPETHQLLTLNLALNALTDRAVTLQSAASDRAGTAEVVLDRRGNAGYRLRTPEGEKADGRPLKSVRSPTVALDDLIEMHLVEPAAVGLLRLGEPEEHQRVLAGAEALLAGGCAVMFTSGGVDGADDIVRATAASHTHFVEISAARKGRGLRPISEIRAALDKGEGDRATLLALRLPRARTARDPGVLADRGSAAEGASSGEDAVPNGQAA